jgi:protein-L-isoaspartate(D-aspartate) O-methyltransferase
MNSNQELIEHLRNRGVLRSPHIIEAFRAVPRELFMPETAESEAYTDMPFPIGGGQTISQPYTVAFMLELLDPHPGQKILDIGSGSGWSTTLLADIVGKKGKIIGVERVPELLEYGRNNLAKFNFPHAQILPAYKQLGLPEEAPFDRILVSAAGDTIPQELLDQLASSGVLVVPVKNSIWRVEKKTDGTLTHREFPGFIFVPLIM